MGNKRWRLLTVVMAGLMSLAINAQEPADSVVAQDFTLETREGRTLRLSELAADRWTLLMFYDPDCSDCRQELFAMRHSSWLRQAVGEGRLQVVCVYAEADEELWRATASELPETWTVAIARTDVHRDYDLSAMPLLLLLDGERHIVRQAYELRDILADSTSY